MTEKDVIYDGMVECKSFQPLYPVGFQFWKMGNITYATEPYGDSIDPCLESGKFYKIINPKENEINITHTVVSDRPSIYVTSCILGKIRLEVIKAPVDFFYKPFKFDKLIPFDFYKPTSKSIYWEFYYVLGNTIFPMNIQPYPDQLPIYGKKASFKRILKEVINFDFLRNITYRYAKLPDGIIITDNKYTNVYYPFNELVVEIGKLEVKKHFVF